MAQRGTEQVAGGLGLLAVCDVAVAAATSQILPRFVQNGLAGVVDPTFLAVGQMNPKVDFSEVMAVFSLHVLHMLLKQQAICRM